MACVLAAPGGAASAPSHSNQAPEIIVTGTAQLFVAGRTTSAIDAPAAWVTFRTTKVIDPRLVVVRVRSVSGRSFRGAPGRTCVRSTVVTDDGRIAITPGRRYRVDFYSREGIGRTRPKVLIAARTLRAATFDVGHSPRAPLCVS